MRRPWRRAGPLGVLAAACGGGGETGDEPAPPDVAGRYNVQVRTAAGCEGDASWVEDWATGPLTVEGPPGGDITYDFGGSMIFHGSVAADSSFRFSGPTEWAGAALDVQASGDFGVDLDRWVMSGAFAVEVDDDEFETNNCTVESDFEAYELVGTD